MLEKIKIALQISTDVFDVELESMINEALGDMGFADITNDDLEDASVSQCVVLYCCSRFELLHGSIDKSVALKKVYDEQKRMLSMATGYTNYES